MEKPQEAVLKSLVAIAWADGQLDDEELEVLEAMLSIFKIGGEDAMRLREYARSPRSLEDVPVAELSRSDREQLLRHAVILSHIDGGQDAAERSVLAAVVKKLEIPEGEASELIAAAEDEARMLLDL
jgi:tellurite resistance protein